MPVTTTNTTSRAGFNGAMHRARQHSPVSIAWGVGRARVVHVRAWACESVMCVRACLGGAARHQGCALRVVAAALAELPDTSVPSSGQPNLDPYLSRTTGAVPNVAAQMCMSPPSSPKMDISTGGHGGIRFGRISGSGGTRNGHSISSRQGGGRLSWPATFGSDYCTSGCPQVYPDRSPISTCLPNSSGRVMDLVPMDIAWHPLEAV